jgi:hypothetical protein
MAFSVSELKESRFEEGWEIFTRRQAFSGWVQSELDLFESNQTHAPNDDDVQ